MSFIVKLPKDSKRKSNVDYSSIESKKTNFTNNEKNKLNKIKIVSFNGGVEIIDVESYKIYNQLGTLKMEALEKNSVNECKVCNCTIL